MRKHIVFAIVVLLVVIACGANDNLLVNGGFEAGPKPWVVSEWSTPSGKVSYTVSQLHKHEGDSSAEVRHISGGSNILLEQKVAIAGKNNLILSFYALGDVQPGKSTPISASFITLDGAGNKLQYVNKPFQATENWQKNSWQFSTHPDTATISIYLRSGGGCVWFDDAKLNVFSGPSITELQLWYPSNEIIPTLMSIAPGRSEITATIKNASGKKVFCEKMTLENGKNFPVLKVDGITHGKWVLEIVDSYGNAIEQSFNWPGTTPSMPGRKNNFVTVIYFQRGVEIRPETPIVFDNPRTGWLFLALCAEQDATLSFEGTPGKEIALKAGEKTEVMRYAQKGVCKITASKPVRLVECDVRTMAELVFCEYEGMESRRHYEPLMAGPAGQALLASSNVIMEGFENGGALDSEKLPDETAERIARWRDSGRKLISHAVRTADKGRIKPKDTTKYWSSRIGMRQFDGIAVDEFAHETPEELKEYCNAINSINADATLRGRTFFAYSCAAWNQHRKSMAFRDCLLAGGGVFAPEVYLREEKGIGEAKSSIDRFFDYLRAWRTLPGSMERLVVVLSSTDGLPRYYGQDTFANVMYKYFLDLQYNLLANDPAFKDLRGVTAWIVRYTKPETVAWLAMLNRHYCIEGNRNMLSERFGFLFELPHLKNPDFQNGLDGWNCKAAEHASIAHAKVTGWGFARGTCNSNGNGDDVAVIKRVQGKANIMTQEIKGLRPGHWYELSCRVADYDDIAGGKSIRKLLPLSMSVSGHQFNAEISFIDVYQSVHGMPPKFPYGKGPCGNEQRLFFKANSPSAILTISDEGVTSGIMAGNDVNAPFLTPKAEEIGNMMLNFIQLQEVLPPELWHGTIKQ